MSARGPSFVHVEAPVTHRPATALLSRPVLAVLSVVALAGLGELPALNGIRVFGAPTARAERERPPDAPPVLEVGEAELGTASTANQAMAAPTAGDVQSARGPIGGQEAPLDLPAIEAEEPPVPIVDPTGHALDGFFRALAKTQAKEAGALTRIAHFGDSIIVSDYVSATLRRKFQEQFGDGGHGYMLMANPWPAYFHNDVFRFATRGFRVSRIVGPLTSDGMYGLGGVTFRAGPGVIAQFGTAEKGDYGTQASRLVVSYLEQPGGGSMIVEADGSPLSVIDTNGPEKVARARTLELKDGSHRFQVSFKGGETRSFGVVLERDGPGVVYDALGVQGARIRFLDKQDDAHWAEQLSWRSPDLVVYQFGANESGDGYAYPMDEYLQTMKAVIAQGQKALPKSSCLIVGAMDRARRQDGITSSMKIIQLIVAEQRRAADQLGCAYFDTYEAMGGWGSMPTWVRRGLGQADMTHPTGVGAQRIGNWIYRALMKRYDEFLASARDDSSGPVDSERRSAPASRSPSSR